MPWLFGICNGNGSLGMVRCCGTEPSRIKGEGFLIRYFHNNRDCKSLSLMVEITNIDQHGIISTRILSCIQDKITIIMTNIKVQIFDDNGIELSIKSYSMGNKLEKLLQIEREIETLRHQILTDITSELVSAEQLKYEKSRLVKREYRTVKLKTMNH